MSDHKEDLAALLANKWGKSTAGSIADLVTDQYAFIPRPDMPILNEDGLAPAAVWNAGIGGRAADRARRIAAVYLAQAEHYEAREAAEAETKLSERRNRVLAEYCERAGYAPDSKYENFPDNSTLRLTVDMILEAQDGARK